MDLAGPFRPLVACRDFLFCRQEILELFLSSNWWTAQDLTEIMAVLEV